MTGAGAAAEYVLAPVGLLTAAPASIPLADAGGLPLVGLTAWQALFDHAKLTAGQRVLINGAGGAVGGYAVQLAKHAGAHVIATAGPRSSERVRTAGADEVFGHGVPELSALVDVVLNLAPVDPMQLAALTSVVRDGGIVVNTTVWMPAPSDEERGVRGVNLFVNSDAAQLARLVTLVDSERCTSTSLDGCRWPSCRRCTRKPRKARSPARSSSFPPPLLSRRRPSSARRSRRVSCKRSSHRR